MTLDAFIPLPPSGFDVATEYRLVPRPKRAFHTILDANRLLVAGSKGRLSFRNVDDDRIELATKYDIADGSIVPGSIGVPPSLTIAALAERIADDLRRVHLGQPAPASA